ncbi:MAG TPA: Na+/H+ antiporter NhaA [Fimbriiglobus sp.]|nr:Na+/H+ antiporter NhaA [Fimbriiglobus sp.]
MHPPARPPLPARPIDRIARPIRRFLAVQSASGVVLAVCTVAAMAAANSSWAAAYHDFWETHLRVGIGRLTLDEPLHFWVNDALMVLFFFVVGLEIKRELVAGELSTAQKAALPVIAAAGGMVVPAGIYLALQWGQPGERGWGIPMATDIAFVVGVLALFGPRVPFGLKIFLLALAIVDDIGAILVIAVAYSSSPSALALGLAAVGFALIVGLNRLGVRAVPVYVVVGAGIWLAVLKSGVHPTVAGVLLGLLTPASVWVGRPVLRDAIADVLLRVTEDNEYEAEDADFRRLEFAARESLSPLERLETALHPWVGFVIMPIFALANAGVTLRVAGFAEPPALAVAAGLVVGKPVGIVGFSYLAVRLGLAALPAGVGWRLLVGAGCLGGIGFTMSLFVAGLAFPGRPDLLDDGKVGIILGSLTSAVLGSGLLLGLLKKT